MVTTAIEAELPVKTIKINLHAGQLRAWQSTKRFVAMLAGTQGGKTIFGPIWLHREIDKTALDKDTRGNDYLAVTANYDLLKLKMLPELLNYFCKNLGIGKYWAGDRIIELSENLIPGKFLAKNKDDDMWGRIIIRSAKAEGGLESGTVKAAWLDESGHPDFSREAWEATQRRLSIFQGRTLFTTTLYEWGWLKIEVFDRWEEEDPDYDVIQFDSTLNPSFPRGEFERAVRTKPKWYVDLFYRGKYSRPAGLIYDSFDTVHCMKSRADVKIGKDWPRFVGHDFGALHTGALWYAQEPGTGYLYLYRTYLTDEKISTANHVAKWKELSGDEPIRKCVGGSHQEEGWREAFTLAGWPISEPLVTGQGSIEIGIDRVYAWHKTNRLFIFNDLLDYLNEKTSFSRELDNEYKPTEKIKEESKFHLMSAERYILSDFQPVDVVRPEQKETITIVGW